MKKTLEELRLDLIEIKAYRDLQDEEFCFDNKTIIKNNNSYSEDAYLEIIEQNLEEEIKDLEDNSKKLKRK